MHRLLKIVLLALLLATCCAFTHVARAYAQDGTPDFTGNDYTNVVIELHTPSAVSVYVAAYESARTANDDESGKLSAADVAQIDALTAAQVAAVAAEQDAFAATLDLLSAAEIYRVQRVYNGIAARVPVSALETLRNDPRVLAVHPLISKTPDNARTMPLIGAPELWSAPHGLTGAGVRIGIIDTGVDYLHVGLGGPGVGYDKNNNKIIGDVEGFPNARVVAGHDFVGDTYNANPSLQPYQPIPYPDPDPMDCYNHGTHVAGSAAGTGVTAAGTAFSGSYSNALDTSAMRIAPGVAPRALIYALKVFGCVGSSDVVDRAIEWAIDPNGDGFFGDHLDIINLSLGSPYGRVEDITSRAVERATQVGIIVVTSMGNSGDNYFITNTPGAVASAITVAATRVDPVTKIPDGSYTDTIAGFSARGPRLHDNLLKPDLAAPGYQITSVSGGTGNGALTISGTSMATPMVTGAIALLHQRYPLWSPVQLKALLMSTATGIVRFDEAYTGRLVAPTRSGAGRISLTEALRSEIIAHSPDTPGAVSLNFGAPEVLGNSNALRNLRVQNVSAEARTLIAEYMPIIDIPGVDVSIGSVPTGTATITIPAASSLNVPIILSVDANAMLNVPDPTIPETQAGAPRNWRSEEQGHVWLWDARGVFTATLSGADATPPSANIDTADVDARYDPVSRVLSFTITTDLAANVIENIAITRGLPGDSLSEVAFDLFARGDGPAVTLPFTGAVTLDMRDAQLLAAGYLQVTVDATGGEIAGTLIAQEPVIKTPLFAAPRPIAAMQAISNTLDMGSAATVNVTLPLTGTALTGTSFPTDTQSVVGAFELHASSPRSLPSNSNTPAFADIQFVGVSSDYLQVSDKSDARLYFAISTWGEWSTPWQTQFVIAIDINEDRVADYRLISTDVAAIGNNKQYSDAFVAAVENLSTGGVLAADPLNVHAPDERLITIFQNNVVVLSVPLSMLNLGESNPHFNFHVATLLRSSVPGEFGDTIGWMQFDVARPALNIRNMPADKFWHEGLTSTQILLGYNLANFTRSTAKGLLLVHPFNAFGKRAEVVNVDFTWPHIVPLPLITTDGF